MAQTVLVEVERRVKGMVLVEVTTCLSVLVLTLVTGLLLTSVL